MDNSGRMFAQVAAEAGVSPNRAKIAVYMSELARNGRSLADAATSLRRHQETVKKVARDFMIDFPDYRPFARLEAKGEPRPEPRCKLDFGHAA